MSPSKADEQLGIDLHNPLTESMCFPGGTRVKSLPANAGDKFDLWIWKIPWRRKWQPTLVFLPGESHGQRSLGGKIELQFLSDAIIPYCWASLLAQTVKSLLKYRRLGLNPWVKKIPWGREQPPTPVFLPGQFHGQRSLAATCCGVTKSHKEPDVSGQYVIYARITNFNATYVRNEK